jgi:hypothetical protein
MVSLTLADLGAPRTPTCQSELDPNALELSSGNYATRNELFELLFGDDEVYKMYPTTASTH